jgi:glucuronosyltransferase
MKTFAKFKQRVIFKWESNELPGKPDNVLTDKWLPQDDILANEKVRLFISHCGLGGLAEGKKFDSLSRKISS